MKKVYAHDGTRALCHLGVAQWERVRPNSIAETRKVVLLSFRDRGRLRAVGFRLMGHRGRAGNVETTGQQWAFLFFSLAAWANEFDIYWMLTAILSVLLRAA